jgi:DNA-binding NtrC family response regulator
MKDLSTRKKVIFIVDDQLIFAKILKSEIQDASSEVHVFVNGARSLEMMFLRPDIVVLDYELDGDPCMNGIQVLRKIKDADAGVEVIMLSAHEDLSIATTSIKLGAYDYVVKNEQAIDNVKNKIRHIERKMEVMCEVKALRLLKMKMLIAIAVGLFFSILVIQFS